MQCVKSGYCLFLLLASLILNITLTAAPQPVASIVSIKSIAAVETGLRTLTFDERVNKQRAIEEVYWRHRIWPDSNNEPRPSFERSVSDAMISAKVQKYIDESQALRLDAGIERDLLQAEMNRMAAQTRRPDVLRELCSALDNDPALIAECLARPILMDRLSRSESPEFRTPVPVSFSSTHASIDFKAPIQLATAAASCQSQT